jgi:flagellar hook protein FlgE
MIDLINLGMTGMQGYSKGLKVIGNNTSNLNTPGFKSSSLQFTDLLYASGDQRWGMGSGREGQMGRGLNTLGTNLNLKQGDIRQTGNSMDVAVQGEGMFTLVDADGRRHYSRAGQFELNADGILVNRTDGSKVLGRDTNGNNIDISIAGKRTKTGNPTSTVKFRGNLAPIDTEATVESVTVIDQEGVSHVLTLNLTKSTTPTLPGGTSWEFELLDGTNSIATSNLDFVSSMSLLTDTFAVQYTPSGGSTMNLTLDFSTEVTAQAFGTTASDLTMASQDGIANGSLLGVSFDATGSMVLSYSNGHTVKGPRLLLSRFDAQDEILAEGNNQFSIQNKEVWPSGLAGEEGFGTIAGGAIESSNVDLTQELGELVIMQRGYQASSQIVTTANEMIQQLFTMRSK